MQGVHQRRGTRSVVPFAIGRCRPHNGISLLSKTCMATVTINNKLGLHARPAMLFVESASTYESEIRVRRSDHREPVDGKSIMQMMMLAATHGTEVEITATGADAESAVERLVALVDSKFQED